jgi:hypothetical protein
MQASVYLSPDMSLSRAGLTGRCRRTETAANLLRCSRHGLSLARRCIHRRTGPAPRETASV